MGKKGINQKYDWEKALRYFVEGMPVDEDEPDGDRDWPNLRQLAEALGIPYQRVRERASQERWTEQKQAYQVASAQERQRQRMKTMGNKAIEFDDRSLSISEMGLQLIGTRMTEIARMVNARKQSRDAAVERLGQGGAVDRQELWTEVRADEMMSLARAAQTLQEIGMKALGTDIERHVIDANVNVEGGTTINVTAELDRDDPDRLAALFAAADRTGLLDVLLELEGPDEEDDDEVVDGEIVEEGEEDGGA